MKVITFAASKFISMKVSFSIGIAVILFFVNWPTVHAQITPETTYSYSGTYTELSFSGTKFFLMDVGASQCRIYNQNHSLWKTINLSIPANNYLFDIKYVSEGLFTTDNGLCLTYFYYSYNEIGQYYSYNAKIIRENGTVLLNLPGCQYLYIHTLADGSSKLVAYLYDYSVTPYSIQTAVYNLPGTQISLNESHAGQMPAWPNPATDFIQIPYHLSANTQGALIRFFDVNGRELWVKTLEQPAGVLSIPVVSYPRGTYFYRIETPNQPAFVSKIVLN